MHAAMGESALIPTTSGASRAVFRWKTWPGSSRRISFPLSPRLTRKLAPETLVLLRKTPITRFLTMTCMKPAVGMSAECRPELDIFVGLEGLGGGPGATAAAADQAHLEQI